MGKALENIKNIASKEKSDWRHRAMENQVNKAWLKRSFKIAVRVLREIRVQKPINGMTQKKLAEAMEVTPQYINKVVKGKENLTLETIAKIEDVLGINLIEVPPYEVSQIISIGKTEEKLALRSADSVPIAKKVCLPNLSNYSYLTEEYEQIV